MNGILQKNHKKSLKRISAAALVATVTFSTPSVLTALNDGNPIGGVEAYAAEVTNLMNSSDTLTQFHVNYNDSYDHWVHNFHNDGDIPVENADFDISGLKYVVKFPDELAHLLDNQYTKEYLFGQIKNFDAAQNAFTVTGTALDEDGNEVTIHTDQHNPFEHISVNQATNSIEFDFASFYQANNLEPYIREDVVGDYFFNTLGFQTPIVVSDDDLLNNGSYTFKTAIVRGDSINLDNVSNAYEEVLEIDYSKDPEPGIDKNALTSLIDEAKAYAKEDYTEESYASLTEALTAAEEVVSNDDATQEEVDSALSSLETAVEGLEEETTPDPVVEKAELEDLIKKAKGHVKEDYTKESFAPLVEAVQAAEDVLANEDATEEEVNKAQAELEKAIDSLEELPVDKEALTSLIEEMSALNAEDFSKKSFEALTEALTAAEEVLANEDATQKELDAAVDALLTAKDDLERVKPIENPDPGVDASELVALLQNAKQYVKEDYTSETYAALLDAIHNTEELLETKAATEEAIQEVLDSLEVAINGLKEVVQEKPDVEENDEEESLIVDGNSHHSDGDLLPKTATNTYTIGLIGGLLAVVGGVLVAVRKRFTNLFN